ncbi:MULTISPECIES: TolC family protein [unclassified Lentimicrobium]|uniref:TolC family protein n=1 Tax=unclassified Lentimicrobium TaxID=2677434 RepID=UPI001552684C|nr:MULTISPECIES: TolC family protein [unclassified Lentimicrobium]NPD44165.1 TolC family protein [Lentimicrobium sp. S6]NPD84623.1 TolC family protein [Lentimicrobium sp. L6]
MKKIIVICICILGFQMSYAQEDLQVYLKAAAQNNPGLQVKFNEYMAALEVIPQVGSLPDPSFAFGYFILPVETREGPQIAKVSANQMFPWFGSLQAKEDVAVQLAKAKYEAFEEAKSILFNEVKATYYNLYFTRKAIFVMSENQSILHVFKQLALTKIETGKASLNDELRVEMELADLENQLALVQDKYEVLSITFNNLLNVDNESIISIPDLIWEQDLKLDKKALLDSIYANNHQLLSLEYQYHSLESRQQVAKKAGLPNISIGIDYTFIGKGENNLSGKDALLFPKIGITIPLYRNKYKAMVNEVLYLQAAKTEEKFEKELVLETIFENAFKDYKDAQRRISHYSSQGKLAKQSLKLIEVEYSTNAKGFEEMLRMERRLLKYDLELEKARVDKLASIAFVQYLMGQ